MHGNEFEISLSKELTVCKKTIQKIRKTLDLLERKHGKTTAQFIAELASGNLSANADLKDDYDAWKSSYESLKRWEELEKQYREHPRP
jgi:hypothetical protein